MRPGRINMNGISFRHCSTVAMWNNIVSVLAVEGYTGKPYIVGMSSYGSFDLLARVQR